MPIRKCPTIIFRHNILDILDKSVGRLALDY
jgi:hypothetical protein